MTMAEQIIRKLKRLDEQAVALLARRTKEDRHQNLSYRKSLAPPLTFDFDMEFEENITTLKPKAVSKLTEDKSNTTKTQKRSPSFKTTPDPTESSFDKLNFRPHVKFKKKESQPKELVGEKLKSRTFMPLYFMKDTTEAGNAKPLDTVSSLYKKGCQRTSRTTVVDPVPGTWCEVCKKEKRPALYPVSAQPGNLTGEAADLDDHSEGSINKGTLTPQMIDLSTKEKQSIKTNQLCQCPAREKNPLALCLDDELKNPNCKIIIPAGPEKSDNSTEQCESNPIIFHDAEFVQKLILTQNWNHSQSLGSRDIYPCKRASTALGRRHEISEPLVNDRPVTPTSKRTRPTTFKKDRDTASLEVNERIVDKQRQATRLQALEKASQEKIRNFPQNFSDLIKIYTRSLDQTVPPETNTSRDKYEIMFSTEKPVGIHKFSVLPTKYHAKPKERTLQVHFVSTITPLDELLDLPSEYQTNAL